MRLDPDYIRFKKREKNNPSDNQPINQWVPKAVLGGRKRRGVRELLEILETFYILTVVFVTWACRLLSKLISLYTFSGCYR